MIAAETVRVVAPAKINLFLHVGAKRADGYHALESLVVFAKLGDELALEPADEISLAVEGRFAEALSGDPDNLVLKAARALAVTPDLVYVDASHEEVDVYADILAWVPKLAWQGVICGDDWASWAAPRIVLTKLRPVAEYSQAVLTTMPRAQARASASPASLVRP